MADLKLAARAAKVQLLYWTESGHCALFATNRPLLEKTHLFEGIHGKVNDNVRSGLATFPIGSHDGPDKVLVATRLFRVVPTESRNLKPKPKPQRTRNSKPESNKHLKSETLKQKTVTGRQLARGSATEVSPCIYNQHVSCYILVPTV